MSTTEQTLHAARRFDTATLSSVTRGTLRMAKLAASADGTLRGLTVREVDAAMASAGIEGRQAMAAKLELSAAGSLRVF